MSGFEWAVLVLVAEALVRTSATTLLVAAVLWLNRGHLFVWSVFAPRYFYQLFALGFELALLAFANAAVLLARIFVHLA